MEQSHRIELPKTLSRHLQHLPTETALELEDHLVEEISSLLRTGVTPERAAELTAERFGNPRKIGHECWMASHSLWWRNRRTPFDIKLMVAGWMLLSVFTTSRICFATEPSHLSISACILTGVLFAGLGANLMRQTHLGTWITRSVALGITLTSSLLFFYEGIAVFLISRCATLPMILWGIAAFSWITLIIGTKEARLRLHSDSPTK
jgi:hypothetical protein